MAHSSGSQTPSFPRGGVPRRTSIRAARRGANPITSPGVPAMPADLSRVSVIACAALLLAVSPGAARADDSCRGLAVSIPQAIEIAQGAGLAYVSDVECDDRVWEVEGRNADGRKLENDIDARTGRVLKVERD